MERTLLDSSLLDPLLRFLARLPGRGSEDGTSCFLRVAAFLGDASSYFFEAWMTFTCH